MFWWKKTKKVKFAGPDKYFTSINMEDEWSKNALITFLIKWQLARCYHQTVCSQISQNSMYICNLHHIWPNMTHLILIISFLVRTFWKKYFRWCCISNVWSQSFKCLNCFMVSLSTWAGVLDFFEKKYSFVRHAWRPYDV